MLATIIYLCAKYQLYYNPIEMTHHTALNILDLSTVLQTPHLRTNPLATR